MAGNTLLTISDITYETARVLVNNLVFCNQITREYDDQFAVAGAKIGDTINIRKPPRYTVRTGRTASIQNITESYVPLTLQYQEGVDLNWTSADQLLSIDDFSNRILKPAIAPVANNIDLRGLALYKQIYNCLGTPGTTPNALLTYLSAGARLNNEAAPRDNDRSMILSSLSEAYIVDALKGLFQSAQQIEEQYEMGKMGVASGFHWYMDQNVATHTVGPLGGTPLINTNVANTVPGVAFVEGATSMTTDGWTAAAASRLKQGDVFTVANVYALNPQNFQNTGELRQFVVTSDVSSSADGSALVPVAPTLRTTGAFATINAMPANNAAITVLGAANTITPQNMAFHRNAFALGMADLEMPPSVRGSRVTDDELGVSIRVLEGYSIIEDIHIVRMDVLYGYATVYPELCCRVSS